MARQDEARARPDITGIREASALLLPLGASITLALFLVAGAANLGFYDAFGIQDLRLVGIDKSAVIDHALVFGVVLGSIAATLFIFALGLAWLSRWASKRPVRERDRKGTLAQVAFGLAVLVGCVAWLVRAGMEPTLIAVSLFGLAYFALVRGAALRRWTASYPWRLVAMGAALTAATAVAAFFQGAAWGGEVRRLERARPPFPAPILLVLWPHGAVLDATGPEPASTACTDEILLGRSGGSYVLYNVRIERLHEVPTAQRLSRIGLGALTRSGCPGPVAPASAR